MIRLFSIVSSFLGGQQKGFQKWLIVTCEKLIIVLTIMQNALTQEIVTDYQENVNALRAFKEGRAIVPFALGGRIVSSVPAMESAGFHGN